MMECVHRYYCGGLLCRIIKSSEPEQGTAGYNVQICDTTGEGRDLDTSGHLVFTLNEAEQFWKDVVSGEIDLDNVQAIFDAEDMLREREAIQEATRQAKAFRSVLESKGISYTELIELETLRRSLSEIANNILKGWERGEGLPLAEGSGVCE